MDEIEKKLAEIEQTALREKERSSEIEAKVMTLELGKIKLKSSRFSIILLLGIILILTAFSNFGLYTYYKQAREFEQINNEVRIQYNTLEERYNSLEDKYNSLVSKTKNKP